MRYIYGQIFRNGLQIGNVNVGKGNFTFLNRDLVSVDRLPIVAGRVYDSSLVDGQDFGPGWKLTFSEQLSRRNDGSFEYIDANNSTFILDAKGHRLSPRYGRPISGLSGRLTTDSIVLVDSNLAKRFQTFDSGYFLSEVSDRFGNWLRFHYIGDQITSITSSGGRHQSVVRDQQGRIVAIQEKEGRTVSYEYDLHGRLRKATMSDGGEWFYSYSQTNKLVEIVDPLGRTVGDFRYGISGRAVDVRLLQNRMKFEYHTDRTIAMNPIGQKATFSHHHSGVTQSVIDYSGAQTAIEFDPRLRPLHYFLNGIVVAKFHHDTNGRIQRYTEYVDDKSTTYNIRYAENHRLAEIATVDEIIGRYGYDSKGQVIRAQDSQSDRKFTWTDDGRLTGVQVDSVSLLISTNSLGEITQAKYLNGPYLDIGYDELSRVMAIDFDGQRAASFDYQDSKFRSSSQYSADLVVAYDYDFAGNLVRIDFESDGKTSRSDQYEIGENNELLSIESTSGPKFLFGYDGLGRVTELSAGPRRFDIEYDDLSRISRAKIDQQIVVEPNYSPMDFGSAYAADDKTFVSRVPARTSHGVFGTIDELVYGRTKPSLYSLIDFDSRMSRFVLLQIDSLRPDLVTTASLMRRQIYVNESSEFAGVWNFDKPSNALFIPPEYQSVNCFFCLGLITFHTVLLNGSSSSISVDVNDPVSIESTGTVSSCDLANSQLDYLWHRMSFGDGGSVWGTTIPLIPSFSSTHAYGSVASRTVSAEMECNCGVFGISSVSNTVDVQFADQCGLEFEEIVAVFKFSLDFPQAPFEYASALQCYVFPGVGQFIDSAFDRNSFSTGQAQDPCNVLTPYTSTSVSAGHTHPYFTSAAEYHAGVGCLGDQSSVSSSELSAMNSANNNFSNNDKTAARTQMMLPLYLGTPTRSKVKVYKPNPTTWGVSTVWP